MLANSKVMRRSERTADSMIPSLKGRLSMFHYSVYCACTAQCTSLSAAQALPHEIVTSLHASSFMRCCAPGDCQPQPCTHVDVGPTLACVCSPGLWPHGAVQNKHTDACMSSAGVSMQQCIIVSCQPSCAATGSHAECWRVLIWPAVPQYVMSAFS